MILLTGPEESKSYSHFGSQRQLTIELFHGKYESWQEFWRQFDVAMQENVQLSSVQKLNCLMNFLKEAALKCFRGLP